MEKKSKSKSIFSLFSLDWDDKPKSKAEKPPKSGSNSGHPNSNTTSRSHHDLRADEQKRSRSSDKIAPQPAPRICSKPPKEEAPPTNSHSASKRHQIVVKKQSTPSPVPSPRLSRIISTETEKKLKANRRADEARSEKDGKVKEKSSSSNISNQQHKARSKSNVEKSTSPSHNEVVDMDVERALEYLDNSTRFPSMEDRKQYIYHREEEVSQMKLSRDHSNSPSRSKSNRLSKDQLQLSRSRREEEIYSSKTSREEKDSSVTPSTGFPDYTNSRPTASSSNSSPASSRPAFPYISANVLLPKPMGTSEKKPESVLDYTSVEQSPQISKLSTAKASRTAKNSELDEIAKKQGRQAPGYHRHLQLGQLATTPHHHVNDLPSVQQYVISDKTIKTRAHRKADPSRHIIKVSGLAHGGGSIRNLTSLNNDLHKKWDNHLGIEQEDLTFERAVLALIRLRRLDTRLRQNRQEYVQELQLFRGWTDERYIHLLHQIAKSNRQMDELDPLIASLEEFINEQHSPPFVPEDEVLRYPVSLDQRKVFSAYQSNAPYPVYEYNQKPISSSRTKIQAMGLPSSFISQNLNTDPFHPTPRMTQSIGRNGLHSGSFNGSRPTILQTESEPSSEIDRELDALTHQVRQLQMQQEMLGRNSTDSTPNATNELRRLSYEQRNEQAKRINHTTSLGTQEHQNGNVGKVMSSSSLRDVQEAERNKAQHGQCPDKMPEAILDSPSTAKRSGGHISSSLTSPTSSSDEVSVDEPYQYEDFTDTALYDSYFDESMTKLQKVMRDLEQTPVQTTDQKNAFNTHSNFNGYSKQENGLPDTPSMFSSHGYPPLPPTRKLKNGPATKFRRHHTISSGNPSAIYAARRAYSEKNMDNETLSDDIIPSRKSSLNDEEAIPYDFQLRLNSPDPITIPERYLDAETYEQEDDIAKRQRSAKTEAIRRMLAVPEPGTSDRDQREREKLLLITPILAREVTERSRRVALQAKNRIGR